MEEQLQLQRFERKYFINERQAAQVREFVKCYLEPDPFSAGRPDHVYPVHSLYLDTDELLTYWATVHCEKRRFKLRVRFYDEDTRSPLFFEIKRRENECVLKQRGVVHRQAGQLLLAGQLPGPEHLLADNPQQFAALQRFCHLMHRLNAHPLAHVAYEREAWVSPSGNSVRVTIDRAVRGETCHEPRFGTQMRQPVFPFGKMRVLELKFTNRFPDWFRDLVQHFDLVQTGAPKYCGCIGEWAEQPRSWSARHESRQTLAKISGFC